MSLGFKSTYLANAILNSVLGGADFPAAPSSLQVALYLAAPTATGGGTEVSGGGYGRLSVNNNPANFPTTTDRYKFNGLPWNFGPASADWGAVIWVAVWDDAQLLYAGPLTNPRTVFAGDPFHIPAGGAVFTEI